MKSKIKNIIIVAAVVVVLVLIYIFFIKKDSTNATLTSSTTVVNTSNSDIAALNDETEQISRDFISLLLSVKSIKLDDSIFKSEAFLSLRDSSITLVQDGNEGRPNPFAPIGAEVIVLPTSALLGSDASSIIGGTTLNVGTGTSTNKTSNNN